MTAEHIDAPANSAPKQGSRRVRQLSLLTAVLVAAIGTAYYGAVALPAQNKASETKACKAFMLGYTEARIGFVGEAMNKVHTPSLATAISNYLTPLNAGVSKASAIEIPEGKVKQALSSVSSESRNYAGEKSTSNPVFPTALDKKAMALESLCIPIIHSNNSATPAPTASK
jgi:hypothetical protein